MKQILVLLILICLAKLAFAKVTIPDLTGHVNDNAHVLSDQAISEIENKLRQHEKLLLIRL